MIEYLLKNIFHVESLNIRIEKLNKNTLARGKMSGNYIHTRRNDYYVKLWSRKLFLLKYVYARKKQLCLAWNWIFCCVWTHVKLDCGGGETPARGFCSINRVLTRLNSDEYFQSRDQNAASRQRQVFRLIPVRLSKLKLSFLHVGLADGIFLFGAIDRCKNAANSLVAFTWN